jgi:C-terminal processing protease CtpA/Prc
VSPLDNLIALTRAGGYVRFFHVAPSAAVDWSALLRAGVERTEPAGDPRRLAEVLRDLVHPAAPAVQVFPTGAPPPQWRDSRQPFTADLEGGVTVRIPLALETACAVPGLLAAGRPSPTDRTARLAILAEAWPVLHHFYPYWDAPSWDAENTDWTAALRTALLAAATDRNDEDDAAFARTLRRFVSALRDGHGAVVRGAGLPFVPPLAWDWMEDRLAVTSGLSPLRPGDLILEIDGAPAAEALAAEEELTSAATPQHRRAQALATLAAGPPGTEIELAVQPAEGPVRTVKLRRSQPVDDLVSPLDRIAEVRPGIFYLDVRRATDEDFRIALPRLAAARGVVFDLRGHPKMSKTFLQHLTDHSLDSAHWDLPVTVRPDRKGTTWHRSRWTLQPASPRLRGNLAFLTNGAAISYAETMLGIVEHYKLGEIVGGPTGGTNGNALWLHLPAGYSLRWTGMRVMKHDGTRHHSVGIRPTVPVTPTLAGVRAGRDEVLERGVGAVREGAATGRGRARLSDLTSCG